MRRRNRSQVAADARQRNLQLLSDLGAQLRISRDRRRLRLAGVSERAGLSISAISSIERGRGGTFSADSLQTVALAVGRKLDLRLAADTLQEPADAGDLAIQELVLRLGRAAGFGRTFELQTRPADPARSADVGLRDDRRRLLVLVECWNTIGDVGAAARSSDRKRPKPSSSRSRSGHCERTGRSCRIACTAAGSCARRPAIGLSWRAIRKCSRRASRAHRPTGSEP